MSVLQSRLMEQETVDTFNKVRGREVPTSGDRNIPPRVKKMTRKTLRKMRGQRFQFD